MTDKTISYRAVARRERGLTAGTRAVWETVIPYCEKISHAFSSARHFEVQTWVQCIE
jgi:hypothetical protein